MDDDIKQFLSDKCVVVQGRDHNFRPIIIIRAKQLMSYWKQKGIETTIKSMGFVLNFVINGLMLDGQVENWIVIFDLIDQSISSINFKVFYDL